MSKFQLCTLARSQDLKKGGLFWKSETTASDLDPNFHCFDPKISARVGYLDGFSAQKQVISKKKVFAEFEADFSTKIGNSNGVSAQKQVISKKKVFAEIEADFSAKIGNSNGVSAQKQVISKKK